MSFGKKIINWYEKNKRELPWRNTKNPYLIWLSEIILQQTRIDQGLPYYYKFSETYPDVSALAKANIDDVLKLWQGLGYYTRARNLHATAKIIDKDFSGKFPGEYESIKKLKGIGDYTASAIASFAFNHKHPVVDGNVYRLLSRQFGIYTPVDTSRGKKEFTALAETLMEDFPPSIYNQAIMEFGSVVCKPANPQCDICPLSASCFAFNSKKVSSLPVKKSKAKTRNRYFNYLVIRNKNFFYIRKRIAKDIWQGLHDFPLIETNNRDDVSEIIRSPEWKKTFNNKNVALLKVSHEFRHVLSHQHIHARFIEVVVKASILKESHPEWKKVTPVSVKKFAVPRLIEKFLDTL